MQPADFTFLSDLLRRHSGLSLAEDKTYLLESRLLPVARERGLESLEHLCDVLRTEQDAGLLLDVVESMTTNETSFFRDIKPYEQFRSQILPLVMERKSADRHLRIWSAACSKGQEPYSIAMCLAEEKARMDGWKVDLVATDLSGRMVEKAKTATYSQFEVQRGLPIQMLVKYFEQKEASTWQLKADIRSMVTFRTQNLLQSYDALGRFDIIFCRNVLIYFDGTTKAEVTRQLKEALLPQGALIIGATETLVDPESYFTTVPDFRGAYQRMSQGNVQ